MQGSSGKEYKQPIVLPEQQECSVKECDQTIVLAEQESSVKECNQAVVLAEQLDNLQYVSLSFIL